MLYKVGVVKCEAMHYAILNFALNTFYIEYILNSITLSLRN